MRAVVERIIYARLVGTFDPATIETPVLAGRACAAAAVLLVHHPGEPRSAAPLWHRFPEQLQQSGPFGHPRRLIDRLYISCFPGDDD